MNQVHVTDSVIVVRATVVRGGPPQLFSEFLPQTYSLLGKRVNMMMINDVSNVFGNQTGFYLTLRNSRNKTLLYRYPMIELWPGNIPTDAGYNSRRKRLFNITDVDTSKSEVVVNDWAGPLNPGQVLFDLYFYTADPQLMTTKEVKEVNA